MNDLQHSVMMSWNWVVKDIPWNLYTEWKWTNEYKINLLDVLYIWWIPPCDGCMCLPMPGPSTMVPNSLLIALFFSYYLMYPLEPVIPCIYPVTAYKLHYTLAVTPLTMSKKSLNTLKPHYRCIISYLGTVTFACVLHRKIE